MIPTPRIVQGGGGCDFGANVQHISPPPCPPPTYFTLSTPNDNPSMAEAIQDWLSNCDRHHSDACARSSSKSSIEPKTSWLIDVRDRCIVRGDVSSDYLALSYTWQNKTIQIEKDDELQLFSNNTDILATVNALEQYKSKLPKVILDAIELTSAIGKRYLWVDRLCIVQDNPDKAAEFSSMDHIYSGACMTIVAAAEYGMFSNPNATIHDPEIRNLTSIRCSDSDLKNPTKLAKAAKEDRIQSYYETLCRSKWAQRAWTYQEHILSRRVVFFLGSQIFWQCECAVWDSSQLRPQQDDKTSSETLSEVAPMRQLSVPSWPDFSIYADLVCPYNGRELSHKEDGLSACLGILNYLAPAFPQGFLFGLPRLYIAHALLWQPLKGTYRCTWSPESGGHRPSEPLARRPSLPSWAWCGWQCFIDPESFRSVLNIGPDGHDKPSNGSSWKLRNAVTWEHMASSEESAHDALSTSNHISAWVARAFFLPVATLGFEYASTMERSAFYWAFANPVLVHNPLTSLSKVVVVRDTAGKFSGMIRITGDATCRPGEPIELIAISQGSVKGKCFQNCYEEKVLRRSRYADPRQFHAVYDRDGRWVGNEDKISREDGHNYQVMAEGEYEEVLDLPEYADDQEYQFYNVLWVQRGENDLAYRAGCGRVLAEAWETSNLENIRITLG